MTIFNKKDTADKASPSPLQDTVRILNLAVARIEIAMAEGNEDIAALTESFVAIVNHARQIDNAARKLEDSDVKKSIGENCQQISQRTQAAIMAFQFYDKLSQRMLQTSKTLGALTEIIHDQAKALEPETWQKFEAKIRSQLTLDADQPLLEDILNGVSVEKAVRNASSKPGEDDIEFF